MIHELPEIVLAEGIRYASIDEAFPIADDAAWQELEKLKGSWVLVYWVFDGQERSVAERYVMTFDAENFTILRGATLIERGRVEGLDPERRPKSYDYVPTETGGRPVSVKFPGIYLLEDDLFVACIGYKGARPGAFSVEAGDQNELVVYRRLKG
jgi:uncharacterized protein (TIGR03067 family)